VPKPSWVSYAAQAALAGARPHFVPAPPGEGGICDPAALARAVTTARATGRRIGSVIVTLPQQPHRAPGLGLLDHGAQRGHGLGGGHNRPQPHGLEVRPHRPVALPAADVDCERRLEVQGLIAQDQLGGGAVERHRLTPAQRAQHRLQRRGALAGAAMRHRLIQGDRAELAEIGDGPQACVVVRGDRLSPHETTARAAGRSHVPPR
jgi:hypothetical protein